MVVYLLDDNSKVGGMSDSVPKVFSFLQLLTQLSLHHFTASNLFVVLQQSIIKYHSMFVYLGTLTEVGKAIVRDWST